MHSTAMTVSSRFLVKRRCSRFLVKWRCGTPGHLGDDEDFVGGEAVLRAFDRRAHSAAADGDEDVLRLRKRTPRHASEPLAVLLMLSAVSPPKA